MSILSLLGGLTGIGDLIKDVREAITGEKIKDPEKLKELDLKLASLEAGLQQGQIKINEAEAQNPKLFISGARASVIWTCSFSLLFNFVLRRLFMWYIAIEGLKITPPPAIDTSQLYPLLLALLGFGGYRTFEKVKGVNHLHG